jgi:hypothetical protein
MRQAVAALVMARAGAPREEPGSRAEAFPEEPKAARTTRRRRTVWLAWLVTVWKATHAGG